MMISKPTAADVEALGEPTFGICDRYQYETRVHNIDLDTQAYDAVISIFMREPLEVVLGFIDQLHPAAAEVIAELTRTYRRWWGSTA